MDELKTILRPNWRRCLLVSAVSLIFLTAVPGLATAVPMIDVSPGTSPAGGYLPLSAFGVPPIGGVGNDTNTSFNVSPFSYAGETWTNVGVDSNGYVVVGSSPVSNPINQNLPDPNGPNNVLAPFWTDLDPSAAGAIRIATLTDGADTWIVVDWAGLRNFSNLTTNTFEAWIGITGDANPGEDITFVYGGVGTGNLGLLTVGAEDKTGTVGDVFYFNGIGTLPTNSTQLRVRTDGLPVSQVPGPGTLALVVCGAAALAIQRRVSART